MRFVLALLALAVAFPAQAATYKFRLQLEEDYVWELQRDYHDGTRCGYGDECYPEGFRLTNGYFSHLNPGDPTWAFLDTDAGTATIGGWDVIGTYITTTPFVAQFIGVNPTGGTRFTGDLVRVGCEGPRGFNYTGYCEAGQENSYTALPDGYCGYYGYGADFDVLSISEVPVPAPALLLLSGVAFLGYRRRSRARRAG